MEKIDFSRKEKITILILLGLALTSFLLDNAAKEFAGRIQNSSLNTILFVFTFDILLFLPLLLIASFYLFKKSRKDSIYPLWFAFGITYFVVFVLKFIVARPRPDGVIMTTIFSMPDYSFPSAHAALAFVILGAMDEEFARVKKAWILLAAIIALSRVYFGLHYFSDVCFGAFLGYFTSVAIIKKIKEKNKRRR